MTRASLALTGLAMFAALSVLALLFAMYRNPLFEVYLTAWGIC